MGNDDADSPEYFRRFPHAFDQSGHPLFAENLVPRGIGRDSPRGLLSLVLVTQTADGGSDGQGVGGGVYKLGSFSFVVTTVIKKNHASTSNDDLFS